MFTIPLIILLILADFEVKPKDFHSRKLVNKLVQQIHVRFNECS